MAYFQVGVLQPLSGALASMSHGSADHYHRFRVVDPVFAVCIGVSAAAIRIRREQIEKFPEQENEIGNL